MRAISMKSVAIMAVVAVIAIPVLSGCSKPADKGHIAATAAKDFLTEKHGGGNHPGQGQMPANVQLQMQQAREQGMQQKGIKPQGQ